MLEEGKLVELHRDPGETSYRVGDIYLGRVRKVMPNLNAGFIDVGYDRDAFLHHSDLGAQYKTLHKWTKLDLYLVSNQFLKLTNSRRKLILTKKGNMQDYVSSSQLVLVGNKKNPLVLKDQD